MFRITLYALLVTLVSSAGHAASITQTLTLENNGEHDQTANDAYDFDGSLFDPTLGTLNSANAVFTGSLASSRFFDSDGTTSYKMSAVTTTSYTVSGYGVSVGNSVSGTVISRLVAPSYPSLPSDAANYSLSEQVSIPIALTTTSSLTGAPNSPLAIPNLLAIRFDTAAGSYVGDGYDLENFNGTASITYNYTPIPEPGTVGLLGLGVIALIAFKRIGRAGQKDPI